MNTHSANRVVITGIGLVTPLGATRETSWKALIRGQRAIRLLQGDECLHFDHSAPKSWTDLRIGAPRPAAQLTDCYDDPVIALAELAAEEAMADANLSHHGIKPERIGCVIGTSKGGLHAYSQLSEVRFKKQDSTTISQQLWPTCWPNAAALRVAQSHDIRGPVHCPVAACATGLHSVIYGVDLITSGQCDLVMAGSSDAALHTGILSSFHRLGVLSRKYRQPAEACRPFDRDRDGFAVGEGAAVLVLESADHAAHRDQSDYGEWVCGRLACDPTGITEMDTQAVSLTNLIKTILQQSNIQPRDIDYVNLHGTATRQNDTIEAAALHNAFGQIASEVSCSSLKGAIGHLLGAASSVELAFALLAMRDDIIPPTVNFEHPDPNCLLDVTPNTARQKSVNQIMKLSLGFGGHLAAAVIRKSTNSR